MSYFISNFVTAVRLQFQMMIYSQFFLSNYRRSNKSKNQIKSIYSIQSKFSKTESNQFFLIFFNTKILNEMMYKTSPIDILDEKSSRSRKPPEQIMAHGAKQRLPIFLFSIKKVLVSFS